MELPFLVVRIHQASSGLSSADVFLARSPYTVQSGDVIAHPTFMPKRPGDPLDRHILRMYESWNGTLRRDINGRISFTIRCKGHEWKVFYDRNLKPCVRARL